MLHETALRNSKLVVWEFFKSSCPLNSWIISTTDFLKGRLSIACISTPIVANAEYLHALSNFVLTIEINYLFLKGPRDKQDQISEYLPY